MRKVFNNKSVSSHFFFSLAFICTCVQPINKYDIPETWNQFSESFPIIGEQRCTIRSLDTNYNKASTNISKILEKSKWH